MVHSSQWLAYSSSYCTALTGTFLFCRALTPLTPQTALTPSLLPESPESPTPILIQLNFHVGVHCFSRSYQQPRSFVDLPLSSFGPVPSPMDADKLNSSTGGGPLVAASASASTSASAGHADGPPVRPHSTHRSGRGGHHDNTIIATATTTTPPNPTPNPTPKPPQACSRCRKQKVE